MVMWPQSMIIMSNSWWCGFLVNIFLLNSIMIEIGVKLVEAHGRMFDPPGRGSMWRFGFNVPENYNDMSNYCGGIHRQWEQNNGKCGVCGVGYY